MHSASVVCEVERNAWSRSTCGKSDSARDDLRRAIGAQRRRMGSTACSASVHVSRQIHSASDALHCGLQSSRSLSPGGRAESGLAGAGGAAAVPDVAVALEELG